MENVGKVNPFIATVLRTDMGTVTTLTAAHGITEKGAVSFEEKALMANYVYAANDTYQLIYTMVDKEGTCESFAEADGVLPTLFLSPGNKAFVSVVPYHPDKESEISIPVFDRGHTELPKGNKPFTGHFIGTTAQFSVFHDIDIWSDTKPDKLLAIEFKNGAIKKKHQVKIPLPRNNKIFMEHHAIHLLAKEGNGWLHRQIDEKGNEVKSRKLLTKQKNFRQAIFLSFDQYSYLLAQEKGTIFVEKIAIDGQTELIELIDITDPFFNTWQPVKIAEETFVIRFNGELGNGWFTIKSGVLLELFYSKGIKGYKNLLTSELLLMNYEDLVISGISKTTDNAYAIVFYPMTERGAKNKELILLNRELKL